MPKEDSDYFLDNIQNNKFDKQIEEYNEYIVNLSRHPKNWGRLSVEDSSVTQSYTGPCGDTVQIFLKIEDGMIKKANFISDGCVACIASASQTTLLIEGKSLNYAKKLKAEDIDNALQGLPDDHKHCTELATRTLKRAIKKYEYYIERE